MAAIISHCSLSPELIYQILLRLPVNSLLRFSSVWPDIITNQRFVHDHFHHKNNKASLLVSWEGVRSPDSIDFYDTKVDGFSLLMGQTLERYEEPDHLQLTGPIYTIMGPCNGLFFVGNTHYKFALWNPSTTRLRPLPFPQVFSERDKIGFGVNPLTDEFKIVLIHPSSRFSIYTLGNDSWRCYITEALLRDSSLSRTRFDGSTFVKGFSYWITLNMRTSAFVLLAFDMRDEVFREIEMPKDVNRPLRDHTRDAVLVTYEDSLVMFCYDHPKAGDVVVWQMKEQGCWTKFLTLDLRPFIRPLGFWNRESILFASYDYYEGYKKEELAVLDLISGRRRIIRIPSREEAYSREVRVFNYKESLYPVKGRIIGGDRGWRGEAAATPKF